MSERVSSGGPSASSDSLASHSARGSLVTVAIFLLGVPFGFLLIWLVESGPLYDETLAHYVAHPVEKAEVILFCCGITALALKVFGYLRERIVFARALLPKPPAKPQPVGEAVNLINHLGMQSGWSSTWLGQRLLGILQFVRARGSANDLDDHLRTLSDSDAMSLEGSYSLLRFINWAIPILGFLGTVVGITEAIAGVTPEILEQSLSGVTGGLATAFDTTALALFLAMILMFGAFVAERLEGSVLEQVDAYVERNLAHRFERTAKEGGEFTASLRQNTDLLVAAVQQLVEKQAEVWARSLEKTEQQSRGVLKTQEAHFTQAIGHALEFALTRHGNRLAELESALLERNQALVESVARLTHALTETSERHQQALGELAARFASQAETLARVQEGEAHLIRLQDALQQNLSLLTATGSFDQAVQSLTAAIHLLTSRAQPGTTLKKAA